MFFFSFFFWTTLHLPSQPAQNPALVTFTEAGRMDLCDLTGVDTSQLIGNDVQLTDRGLELSTDPEDLEDDDEELQFCNCCQGWLDPEEFFDEEEETWCMQCMDEDQQRLTAESS